MVSTLHEGTISPNDIITGDVPEQQIVPASEALPASVLLSKRFIPHHPKAGLNPLADAAGPIFSIIGKLEALTGKPDLESLRKELTEEVNQFHENIKPHGYHAEYTIVCRYILCATIDDIVSKQAWTTKEDWTHYSLLSAFNQDTQHHEKFFTILERALSEPAYYIDLMELIYVCLSLGYQGMYQGSEEKVTKLEQVTNNLYKHIRNHRGNFTKVLSPSPVKAARAFSNIRPPTKASLLILLCTTAFIVMTIFISLGYIMDVIANEAYKNITTIPQPATTQPDRK